MDVSKDALTDLSSIAAGNGSGNVMDELASRLESAPTGLDTGPANTDTAALGTKRKNLLDIIAEQPIPAAIMGAGGSSKPPANAFLRQASQQSTPLHQKFQKMSTGDAFMRQATVASANSTAQGRFTGVDTSLLGRSGTTNITGITYQWQPSGQRSQNQTQMQVLGQSLTNAGAAESEG